MIFLANGETLSELELRVLYVMTISVQIIFAKTLGQFVSQLVPS